MAPPALLTIQFHKMNSDQSFPFHISSIEGEGNGVFLSPFTLEEIQDCLINAEQVMDVDRFIHHQSDPRIIGQKLFEALLSQSDLRRHYDRCLSANDALQIRIKIDPTDLEGFDLLSQIPWEYLFDVERGRYVCLAKGGAIYRQLTRKVGKANNVPVAEDIRILVIPSSPEGASPIDYHSEIATLQELARKNRHFRVDVMPNGDYTQLRNQLQQDEYNIIHFIGHGGFDKTHAVGSLLFENPTGGIYRVTAQDFARPLESCQSLKLVFLNACNTAKVQNTTQMGHQSTFVPYLGVSTGLLHQGVPAVISMQFPISDAAGVLFSTIFYRRLATGGRIDEALHDARHRVCDQNLDGVEWGSPVLFVQSDVDQYLPQLRNDTSKWKWQLAALVFSLVMISIILNPLMNYVTTETDTNSPSHERSEPVDGMPQPATDEASGLKTDDMKSVNEMNPSDINTESSNALSKTALENESKYIVHVVDSGNGTHYEATETLTKLIQATSKNVNQNPSSIDLIERNNLVEIGFNIPRNLANYDLKKFGGKLLLIKMTLTSAKSAGFSGMIEGRAVLKIRVIDTHDGRVIKTFEITENGSGFNSSEAHTNAINRVLDKFVAGQLSLMP